MSVIGSNILAGASGQGGYDIDYSLRCDGGSDAHSSNGGSSAYLKRGPLANGTGDSQRIFTLSCWIKIGSGGLYFTDTVGAPVRTIYAWSDGNGLSNVGIGPTNASEGLMCLKINSHDSGGGYYYNWASTALFRDTTTWYHLVVAMDTTQASQSNRIKAWVNNEQITTWGTQYRPDHNQDVYINGAGHVHQANYIGAALRTVNSSIYNYWDGYIAELHALDGIVKTPSDFAELDPITNMWMAKAYTGTYGTTGIYLNFDDSSALGNDSSGNNNDFTNTNFGPEDQMISTPQNSVGGDFARFNALGSLNEPAKPELQLQKGDLKAVNHTSTSNDNFMGTMMPSTGKWYAECRIGLANTKWVFMLVNQHHSAEATAPYFTDCIRWRNEDGYLNNQNGGWASWGNGFATGNILQVAWDMDNNKMWFGKNNTWEQSGNPATGANPAVTLPTGSDVWTMGINYEDTSANNGTANFGQDSSFAGMVSAQNNADGNSNGDFYYTPPSGFLALCTNNLPDPVIKLPGEYFNTVLYSSDSSNNRAITGVGFQPDLLWLKRRDSTSNTHVFDSIFSQPTESSTKRLATDVPDAAITTTDELDSFDSDGFTIDAGVNGSSQTWVAWNWKAGGTPTVDNSAGAGNTPSAGSVKINGSNLGSALAGTIPVTRLSANTTSGFSIIQYTGTGEEESAGQTVGHGLSVAPKFLIFKVIGASVVWYVNHTDHSATSSKHLQLEGGSALGSSYSGYWNSTNPTASVITLGQYTGLNSTASNMIWCWHDVEGFSKFGSYQGNGDAQTPKSGKFIYLGFRPKYFLTKNVTQTESWNQWDTAREPFNKMSKSLHADSNTAEYTSNTTTYAVDFLSNGVKLRTNYSAVNDVNDYFIYMAFAEWPMKYSRAK